MAVKEKSHTTIEHETVPILAAETVVTRHLKIVDDEGNVRIEVSVRDDGETGPSVRLLDRNGYALAHLTVYDGVGTEASMVNLWLDNGTDDDSSAMLSVGGTRGPRLDLEGPINRGERGTRLELRAESEAAFVVAHRGYERRTLMQLTPGEEPETFVREPASGDPGAPGEAAG